MEPVLFSKIKTKGNDPCIRGGSKIPQISMSRIPVPASATKIPMRVQTSKKIPSPKFSVLQNKPKSGIKVIKPVITKRNSLPFKEFNLTKAGSKPVVKRKSIGKLKKPSVRQTTISEKFGSSKKKENVNYGIKKNSFLRSSTMSSWDCKSMIKSDKKSLKEMQEELNSDFQPSEFYRNQILSNKEITINQLGDFQMPLKDKRNIKDPAQDALERIQQWSAYKKSRASEAKENMPQTSASKVDFRSSEKFSGFGCTDDPFTRRSTWAPSPNKPKFDAFETAMARIKRMSISKAQSPIVERIKEGANIHTRSPIKLTAYDMAMQQLSSLKKSKTVKPESDSKNLVDQNKIDEVEEKASPVDKNLGKTLANLSPKDVFKARSGSIYRPLQNLQTLILSPVVPQMNKHRLTDISEHSENESTSNMSHSLFRLSSKYDRLSMSDSSTRNSTPQSANNETDSSSFKLPIIRSLMEGRSRNAQSAPQSPLAVSRALSASICTTPSSSRILMPVPVSGYTSKPVCGAMSLFEEDTAAGLDSETAPICTPLLLKRIAKTSENDCDSDNSRVERRLDLDKESPDDVASNGGKNDDLDIKWEPRYSTYIKHIPTKMKTEEALADQECALIMSRQNFGFSLCRTSPANPLSVILTKGDRAHFVPINHEVLTH